MGDEFEIMFMNTDYPPNSICIDDNHLQITHSKLLPTVSSGTAITSFFSY
jgi:hypothetical protein